MLCAVAHVSNVLDVDAHLLNFFVLNLLLCTLIVGLVSLDCLRDKLAVLIFLHAFSFLPQPAILGKLILSELLLLVPNGFILLLFLHFLFDDLIFELRHLLLISIPDSVFILGSIFVFGLQLVVQVLPL